jgi:hypothetical protein
MLGFQTGFPGMLGFENTKQLGLLESSCIFLVGTYIEGALGVLAGDQGLRCNGLACRRLDLT